MNPRKRLYPTEREERELRKFEREHGAQKDRVQELVKDWRPIGPHTHHGEEEWFHRHRQLTIEEITTAYAIEDRASGPSDPVLEVSRLYPEEHPVRAFFVTLTALVAIVAVASVLTWGWPL